MSEAKATWTRALAALRSPRGLALAGGALALLLVLRSCTGEPERSFETEPVVREELVVRVTATGTLQPINQVDVGSELSGTIRSVEVDFNAAVRKGQVIARLDTQRLEAQVLQSESALAAAAEYTAHTLRRAGVRCLALRADNGPPWVVIDLACQLADVCLVPLPQYFSPHQTAHALQAAGCDALAAPGPRWAAGSTPATTPAAHRGRW